MSQADPPAEVGMLEVVTSGLAGVMAGFFAFPLFATMSPLCLFGGFFDACGQLSRGTFLFFEAIGIPASAALYWFVAVTMGAGVIFHYHRRVEGAD